jgi:hypothetical protein
MLFAQAFIAVATAAGLQSRLLGFEPRHSLDVKLPPPARGRFGSRQHMLTTARGGS